MQARRRYELEPYILKFTGFDSVRAKCALEIGVGLGVSLITYHKRRMVGLMLLIRYALLGLRSWFSLNDIYARYMKSLGTKAYSVAYARQLLSDFCELKIRTVFTHGDLIESGGVLRYLGSLHSLARKIWAHSFLKQFLTGLGLFMLIEARK